MTSHNISWNIVLNLGLNLPLLACALFKCQWPTSVSRKLNNNCFPNQMWYHSIMLIWEKLNSSINSCENTSLISVSEKRITFYLKGEVHEAELPLFLWGCSGELSADARKHSHLCQTQPILLYVLFNKHTGIPLQHVKGNLPQLYQQLLVLTGPFLTGERE